MAHASEQYSETHQGIRLGDAGAPWWMVFDLVQHPLVTSLFDPKRIKLAKIPLIIIHLGKQYRDICLSGCYNVFHYTTPQTACQPYITLRCSRTVIPGVHDLSECYHLYDLGRHIKCSPSYKFNSLNFDSEKISVITVWDHLNLPIASLKN